MIGTRPRGPCQIYFCLEAAGFSSLEISGCQPGQGLQLQEWMGRGSAARSIALKASTTHSFDRARQFSHGLRSGFLRTSVKQEGLAWHGPTSGRCLRRASVHSLGVKMLSWPPPLEALPYRAHRPIFWTLGSSSGTRLEPGSLVTLAVRGCQTSREPAIQTFSKVLGAGRFISVFGWRTYDLRSATLKWRLDRKPLRAHNFVYWASCNRGDSIKGLDNWSPQPAFQMAKPNPVKNRPGSEPECEPLKMIFKFQRGPSMSMDPKLQVEYNLVRTPQTHIPQLAADT